MSELEDDCSEWDWMTTDVDSCHKDTRHKIIKKKTRGRQNFAIHEESISGREGVHQVQKNYLLVRLEAL